MAEYIPKVRLFFLCQLFWCVFIRFGSLEDLSGLPWYVKNFHFCSIGCALICAGLMVQLVPLGLMDEKNCELFWS